MGVSAVDRLNAEALKRGVVQPYTLSQKIEKMLRERQKPARAPLASKDALDAHMSPLEKEKALANVKGHQVKTVPRPVARVTVQPVAESRPMAFSHQRSRVQQQRTGVQQKLDVFEKMVNQSTRRERDTDDDDGSDSDDNGLQGYKLAVTGGKTKQQTKAARRNFALRSAVKSAYDKKHLLRRAVGDHDEDEDEEEDCATYSAGGSKVCPENKRAQDQDQLLEQIEKAFDLPPKASTLHEEIRNMPKKTNAQLDKRSTELVKLIKLVPTLSSNEIKQMSALAVYSEQLQDAKDRLMTEKKFAQECYQLASTYLNFAGCASGCKREEGDNGAFCITENERKEAFIIYYTRLMSHVKGGSNKVQKYLACLLIAASALQIDINNDDEFLRALVLVKAFSHHKKSKKLTTAEVNSLKTTLQSTFDFPGFSASGAKVLQVVSGPKKPKRVKTAGVHVESGATVR